MRKDGKGHLTLTLMAIWISLLAGFAYWLEMDTRREERERALTTANAFFQQILVSRQWNASHGGVYVPITSTTQPNPYLPVQGRDLIADNGLRLTKLNPAYMTREIAELAAKSVSGIQFHVTSLTPIRPENKAAEWEVRWLNSFAQGVKEQGEFFEEGNTSWFRYMAPLLTGPECLKCHAQQGYREGDIRGGISISMPYRARTHFLLIAGFGSVAVLGLIFIFIGGIVLGRKQRLFDATFNSPVPTSVTDKNHTILMANESYWETFGSLPADQKKIKCYDHRPGKSCRTENCPISKIMQGAGTYTYESVKEKDGVFRHFIINAKPLLDAKGKVVGSVESFQDITERKQAEQALEGSNRKLEALSNTDGLTGIANRRRFDQVLEKEYARHVRTSAKLSLILLDIDQFKTFNDCYGHISGDECLQQVARVMSDCATRPGDLVARYGGEEFSCILPETGSRGAVMIAEKIRRGIMGLAIPHAGSSVAECVTASLGVVTVECAAEGSAMDILAQVDALLYRAKASGRNRVEFVAAREVGEEIKANLVQLAWQESFSCGNHLIDSQHQNLLRLSNELLDAVLMARPALEISPIITRLLAEISQHFHDEESILEKTGFPGLSHHVEEHAKMLAKGHDLLEGLKTSTLMVGDVFQFLVYEVVMRHMLEADRDFFPFVNESDAADS